MKEVSGGSSDVKVSTKDGNAIETVSGSTDPDEDGIFVEDLSQKVNQINIAQKTVNEGLDYILCSFDFVTLTLDTRIPFTKVEGNLEATSDTIKLNEGRNTLCCINIIYRIYCCYSSYFSYYDISIIPSSRAGCD